MGLHVHFLNLHVQDTMIILEEGNLIHPPCPRCDMLVLWDAFNGRHPNTAQCAKGVERNLCRLAAEEIQAITERYFRSYGLPLTLVSSFKYLGQILTN